VSQVELDCVHPANRELASRVSARDYTRAVEVAAADGVASDAAASDEIAERHFYAAIAYCRRCESGTGEQKTEWLARAVAHAAELERMAVHPPHGFEGERMLVCAEIARAEHRDLAAQDLYELSIRRAREGLRTHIEALGYELAADYYRTRGLTICADVHIVKAHAAYAQSGAHARARELEQEYASAFVELTDERSSVHRTKIYMSHAERLSHTGTFSWKPATRELFWSEELFRIFGVELGTPSIDAFRQRLHPGDRAQLEALLEDASRLEDRVIEQRLVMPDGSLKYITVVAQPVGPEDNPRECYVGAIRDITEVRNSEEALQRTQAALADATRVATLGELAAAIAHEVNQPLAGIGLNASTALRLIGRGEAGIADAKEALSRLSRDVTRAGDVIKRLRALLMRSAGEKAPVNVNDAVAEVMALTRGQIQRIGGSLRLESEVAMPIAMADRVQLQQVVINLVLNAADAIREFHDRPKQVTIRTLQPCRDSIRVEVSDSGSGVPEESSARIFEAFYSTKPGGMGMGLSVSKTIIESHGGTLSFIANDGPGTTFSFTLPAVPPDTVSPHSA
jgi:PAS domain S-box-containing protein